MYKCECTFLSPSALVTSTRPGVSHEYATISTQQSRGQHLHTEHAGDTSKLLVLFIFCLRPQNGKVIFKTGIAYRRMLLLSLSLSPSYIQTHVVVVSLPSLLNTAYRSSLLDH